MDLTQRRLTAEEWVALEILVPPNEMKILKMIKEGYDNVNITYNDTITLINFSKISVNSTPYAQEIGCQSSDNTYALEPP